MAKRVVIVDNLLTQILGDEAVILNLNDEKYYTLNGVALRMWQVLTSGVSIDEAVDILCAEYDVEKSILYEDMEKFIQHLRNLVLIETADV